MTTLTMRVVTGPDIPPMRFKSRPEARDWCKTHYPGSPIKESAPRRAASKIQGVTLSPDVGEGARKEVGRNRSLAREMTQRRGARARRSCHSQPHLTAGLFVWGPRARVDGLERSNTMHRQKLQGRIGLARPEKKCPDGPSHDPCAGIISLRRKEPALGVPGHE